MYVSPFVKYDDELWLLVFIKPHSFQAAKISRLVSGQWVTKWVPAYKVMVVTH